MWLKKYGENTTEIYFIEMVSWVTRTKKKELVTGDTTLGFLSESVQVLV